MGVLVYGTLRLQQGEYEGRPWFRAVVSEIQFDKNGDESEPIEVAMSCNQEQYKKLKSMKATRLLCVRA